MEPLNNKTEKSIWDDYQQPIDALEKLSDIAGEESNNIQRGLNSIQQSIIQSSSSIRGVGLMSQIESGNIMPYKKLELTSKKERDFTMYGGKEAINQFQKSIADTFNKLGKGRHGK